MAAQFRRHLEPRAEADTKEFLLIEGLFQDWVSYIETDRTEGRFPGYAGAGRQPQLARLLHDYVRQRGIAAVEIDVKETPEIGEDPSRQPKLLRQSQRESHAQRADIIIVATQCIASTGIARADTGGGEPAQIVAADEKAILDPHPLPEAADVAELPGRADHPLGIERIEPATREIVADTA